MNYGLIAGNGRFPFLVIEGAQRAGVQLVVAAIREEADPALEQFAKKIEWVRIGQLGKLIRFLKSESVTKATMAGQVKHVQIFSGAIPDARMVKMLLRLPRRNTNALIGGVADELARDGIELIDSTYFLSDYLPPLGIMTRRAPSTQERGDIAYGLEIARQIAPLDLGQTIVIRARACVAIEAMEGTDATIKRAGQLVRGRLTIIKVAKPHQDMRFDVPVVGVPTIETMIESGATCLALTALKTLVFDQNQMIDLANRHRISVVAV